MLFITSNSPLNMVTESIQFVRTVKETFFDNEIEIIERHASLILRLKNEPKNRIQRIILLPPYGFTANQTDETNPHPEARRAKIEIKGAIRNEKQNFSLLKHVIKYQYYTSRNVSNNSDGLNPKIGQNGYREEIKSSKDVFYVVRENGIGFYHSIVNISSDWMVLTLDKEMRLDKTPDIDSKIIGLDKKHANLLTTLYDKICLYGDDIFEQEEKIIADVCNAEDEKVLPALIEMLNIIETGKHEACTIFALILKRGRNNNTVAKLIESALRNNEAPSYYLENLIKKLIA